MNTNEGTSKGSVDFPSCRWEIPENFPFVCQENFPPKEVQK